MFKYQVGRQQKITVFVVVSVLLFRQREVERKGPCSLLTFLPCRRPLESSIRHLKK